MISAQKPETKAKKREEDRLRVDLETIRTEFLPSCAASKPSPVGNSRHSNTSQVSLGLSPVRFMQRTLNQAVFDGFSKVC